MRNRGFTIIELLVSIAIISIIAAILFPVLSKARARAVQTVCASNMMQVSAGLSLYEADNNALPPLGKPWVFVEWEKLIFDYVRADLRCPLFRENGFWHETNAPKYRGYGLNQCVFGDEEKRIDSQTVLLTEVAELAMVTNVNSKGIYESRSVGHSIISGPDIYVHAPSEWYPSQGFTAVLPFGSLRHRNGANYVFADGHLKWYRPTDFMLPKRGFGCQFEGSMSVDDSRPRYATEFPSKP